jgi:hypothetical protein
VGGRRAAGVGQSALARVRVGDTGRLRFRFGLRERVCPESRWACSQLVRCARLDGARWDARSAQLSVSAGHLPGMSQGWDAGVDGTIPTRFQARQCRETAHSALAPTGIDAFERPVADHAGEPAAILLAREDEAADRQLAALMVAVEQVDGQDLTR